MLAFVALSLATPHNSALQFLKDDQIAIVPYQKSMDISEMTLECWIKVDPSVTERFFNYVVCRNYGNLGYGMALHGRPTKVISQAPSKSVPINAWTHVALVSSRTARKVYVNGELVLTESGDARLQPFTHPLMIGNSDMTGEPGNTRTPLKGAIDELRIWSKPLNERQIKREMQRKLTGHERNLVGYFPFDEGQGQTIHDKSNHLSFGTLGATDLVDGDDPVWTEGVSLD